MKIIDILKKYRRIAEFTMYAWCLMGNHVHLLLREGKEELATTMKRIGVSYESFYNWKYTTTGHLFQDRFKRKNRPSAVERFKEFNELTYHDECLGDSYRRRKLTDEQAREKIRKLLGGIGIAHEKSLPGWQRDYYLIQVKTFEGSTLRQVARILCTSKDLVNRPGGKFL